VARFTATAYSADVSGLNVGSWAVQCSWATFSSKVNHTNFKVVFSAEKNGDTRRKVALFSANKIHAIHFCVSWQKHPFPLDFAINFFTKVKKREAYQSKRPSNWSICKSPEEIPGNHDIIKISILLNNID
jgi:hypothetical protein